MSKKGGNTLLAFIVGAAAGAVLGILYAPDKGVNTRQKLSFQLEKYKHQLQNLINDLIAGKETPLTTAAKSQGQRVVDDAKMKAEKLLEDVDDLLEQIKGKKS